MAKNINVTYYDDTDPNFDYYKEQYQECRGLTDEEMQNVTEDDIWRYISECREFEWECLEDNLRYSEQANEPCVITGSLGLWHGRAVLTLHDVCAAFAAAGVKAGKYAAQRAHALCAAAAAKYQSAQKWMDEVHDFRVTPTPIGEPELMTGREYVRMVVLVVLALLALCIDYDRLIMN